MHGEALMGGLFTLLLSIGFALFILLITRQLWCWFFRINEMVALQEKQLALLTIIANQAGARPEGVEADFKGERFTVMSGGQYDGWKQCPACKKLSPVEAEGCLHCTFREKAKP